MRCHLGAEVQPLTIIPDNEQWPGDAETPAECLTHLLGPTMHYDDDSQSTYDGAFQCVVCFRKAVVRAHRIPQTLSVS